jgi:hypothetical protein
MAITQAFELDGVNVSTAEIYLTTGTTTPGPQSTAGVYQVWIDAYQMAKGDEFRFRGYEKVEATGGTAKVFFQATLQGVQTEVFCTPTFILMNAWDFTLLRIAGADRLFDASVRKVA